MDPTDRQLVSWQSYIVLERRIFLEGPTIPIGPLATRLRRVDSDELAWIDPDTPVVRGAHRGIVWHRFINDDAEPGVANAGG
jgi:hypothetical protein